MKTLTQWDPLQDLSNFSNRLSTYFGRPLMSPSNGDDDWFTKAQWAPPVDIEETEKEYLIRAELPGMDKEHIKVTTEKGVLLISGERKSEREEKKGKKYHRAEMTYGSFLRSFALPEDADPKQIRAEFKNGVLNVHLAKSEAARPKSVEIKVD